MGGNEKLSMGKGNLRNLKKGGAPASQGLWWLLGG